MTYNRYYYYENLPSQLISVGLVHTHWHNYMELKCEYHNGLYVLMQCFGLLI